MTRPIYEPTPARADASLDYGQQQLFRRPANPGVHYPICFRAAMGPTADPENDRVHYPSAQGGDNVYWDKWDLQYDTTVYDTGPYEQTVLGIPVIAGVGLLQIGIYSIHAQIDLNDTLNGVTLFNSNYDQGQATYAEVVNCAGSDLFLGDFYGIRLDHWRQVVSLPPPDQLWGGEATTVEIVFAQNNDATVVFYSDAAPGVGCPAPVAGSDVWIPGGYDGAWGLVPNMIVKYWGPTDNDPDWPATVVST